MSMTLCQDFTFLKINLGDAHLTQLGVHAGSWQQ